MRPRASAHGLTGEANAAPCCRRCARRSRVPVEKGRQGMADRSRWDPEMAAFTAKAAAAAANYPPIRLEVPLDPHRATNDALSLPYARGGPAMAETADRWIAAHGRRIFCRVYRPRVDRAVPTMVYFHGGGWVWASVDTH